MNPARVHPALQNQILDQPPNVVFGEGATKGGSQAETAPQPAGDIVLASTLAHRR